MFDEWLQLFLMKRGGEEIYVGPLGHHSSELIKYFEVRWYYKNFQIFLDFFRITNYIILVHIVQGIQGVRKIKDGYNPATWMLEVTTVSQEQILGVDFCDLYKKSELYQWATCNPPINCFSHIHFSSMEELTSNIENVLDHRL